MRALAVSLLAAAAIAAPIAVAQADPSEYGIKSVSASLSTHQAGAHPDFSLALELLTDSNEQLPSTTQTLSIALPPGLLANPEAIPKCSVLQLVSTNVEDKTNGTGCPQDSQVGVTEVQLFRNGSFVPFTEPVYNMESPGGDVAGRLGFIAQFVPVVIDARLRPSDYGVTAVAQGLSSFIPLRAATTTLWGVPASKSHDGQRITPYEAANNNGVPEMPGGERPSGLAPAPFMVNPTRCGNTTEIGVTATSYAEPERPVSQPAPLPLITGCEGLDFRPSIDFSPTTKSADSPSGMAVDLSLPQDGLKNPNLFAQADLKRAVVTLPEGLALNPSAARGLGACSEAEVGLVSEHPIEFNASPPACPGSSKVGSAEIRTPLLAGPIDGALYLARADDNPFDTLLAGYLVAQGQGVTLKLAGRFDVDAATGRITATFDDNPQAPFETVSLHFKEGSGGVLTTPPACGSYAIHSILSPWSAHDPFNPAPNEQVALDDLFEIGSGPGGGECPAGRFDPTLEAGTTNALAGAYSPFVLRLSREDGTQRFASFATTLPPGLTGRLAGIPYCPESGISAAAALGGIGEGARELQAPSCPAASRIGRVVTGAGSGPSPFYLDTGTAYLAGPYRGAPLSVVVIAPAIAGPFDLGNVAVRTALRVDPGTAQVTAVSDPLPTSLHGIPLDLRDIRVALDRPRFTLNPTNCREMRVLASVASTGGSVARPESRFQVGGCSGLGFKPKLSMRLTGKTNRGAHPRFQAVLRPRSGDANIARVQVALPHAEFLEQAHIRTICTRVQFAAQECPERAIYGHATAYSPLLDEPLRGPVYLRSSSHRLPDLVIALSGQIDFDAVGRIDSIKGEVRTTFDVLPDAPVSRVVLTMQGGKKGLLVNSRNLCQAPSHATAELKAHNGRVVQLSPVLHNDCNARPGRP